MSLSEHLNALAYFILCYRLPYKSSHTYNTLQDLRIAPRLARFVNMKPPKAAEI
jgi:hypothetical protein